MNRPTHTFPAHRYLERKKADDPRTVVADFDETCTKAPEHIGYVLTALRAQGSRVVILTGNDAPADDLAKRLDDYGIPYDDLIQYQDSDSSGIVRAEYLQQLDAWLAVDNRIDRSPTYVKVCPHLFLVSKPTGEAKDDAKGGKKAAKKATRMEHRGAPQPPPNLRASDSDESDQPDQPEHECGTCKMFDDGLCWGYGNLPVEGEWVCDSWSLDPDWQQQDAAQDAADQTP